MGHRALVAVETRPGRYACYRSQWGGRALGERSRSPESVVSAAVAERGDDGSALAVLDALDPRDHEALFVARLDGDVEQFLVIWLGLVLADGVVAPGSSVPVEGAALVPVADRAVARRLATWLRVAKDVLGDAVDAGALSPAAAALALRELLARHPEVPPETLWLAGE